jgi:HPt (histidine-containing phosphotransfer) domain-containing protein
MLHGRSAVIEDASTRQCHCVLHAAVVSQSGTTIFKSVLPAPATPVSPSLIQPQVSSSHQLNLTPVVAPRVPFLPSGRVRPSSKNETANISGTARGAQSMGTTMSSSILNMTDLMHRVDGDRELLAELFFIFKTTFPAHLERLSDAVARNENKQVESESHALKGMLLNLSAPRAAAAASALEQMGRERQSRGMAQALAELQAEVEALLSQINGYDVDPQS